ncbi:transcription repressor OFP8-like [Phragmites australis]|uniref:transcription repressor OFP8-like n=1 Tax=Phragmites australis TaxID=29695 RepID=UPI002D76A0F8|nr:transcription repressor OFP8-like [Phragmites australis]
MNSPVQSSARESYMDKSRHDKAGGDGDGVGVGMGARLRQRLAQILLNSSCTTTSATAFVGLANTNAAAATSRQEPPPAGRAHEPRSKLNGRCQRRHRRRSVRALVHVSIDCSGHSIGAAALLPSPMPANGVTAVKSGTRKGSSNNLRPPSYSWSPSTDTDEERREDADTRSTLFSSLSFSSDSTSDFYNTTGGSTRPKRHKNPPRRAPPRRAPKPHDASQPPTDKHEKENKMDGKDRGAVAAAGSMAVVKRSHNPYADFRSSMVEMVAGQRICGADALSELLVWYLSLNSPRHHPAILAAFEDVWDAVLGSEP